jgi:hypothetical protein
MDLRFWDKKGKERPQEYSKNVAGGGRSNVPSHATLIGISRVPTNNVERMDPDEIRPAPTRDRYYSLPFTNKNCMCEKGAQLEIIPNEKRFVQEQGLKFI